ncbi:MAG: bifunctional folylpolyglutamate synthase/dihydrofolate synthase [Lachnospiraceae bacterium]|nr:bifunctional folylpolyglutamate synthase/dihydrofolate synthase [Lachnospiraceae bacterium]
MNYKEALEYMEGLSVHGISPGLSGIERLCGHIGNPQDSLKFVHIAGTNGKGSTLAFISSVLKTAGYRVGRYISPTIFEYRERIQVNEAYITKTAFAEGVSLIKEACESIVSEGYPHPTAFEADTALAFWYFKEKKCDIVVLETGMGGREDATNIIKNTLVSVITSIGYDHMKFLGDTLSKIASEKAGIIKPGGSVVYLQGELSAEAPIIERATALHSNVFVAERENIKNIKYLKSKTVFDYKSLKKIEIPFLGEYQPENAITAIEAINALSSAGYKVKEEKLREGLKGAAKNFYGRFEIISRNPLFIVDGAHNPDGAAKLSKSIEIYFTNRRIIYIMGVLADKDYLRMTDLTCGYADQIITLTPPDNKRALSGYELAKVISRAHRSVTAVDSVEEAVEMAHIMAGKEDVIIAFGSLSFLGRLINAEKLRK